MKHTWSVCILLLIVSTAFGADYIPYNWEENRTKYSLTAAEQELPELILKAHTQFDYELKDGEFLMYATFHYIIFVNSSDAVQRNNRITISMSNATDLVDLKARSISKNGKVLLFDKNNIKELVNEERGSGSKIFAIEGAEAGSEIEYFYIKKMTPVVYERVFMQYDVPVKQSSMKLSCPEQLKFEFKSYYDLPAVVASESNGSRMYNVVTQDIPAIGDEPFAYPSTKRKRIEFKLAYNTSRSQARLNTWDDAAKSFYKSLSETSREDQKALDKLISSVDNHATDQSARIRHIEDVVKATIKINKENRDPALSVIESIVKSNIASRQGMTKLFVALFERLHIPYQVVVTCSREIVAFDSTFDTWNFLEDYVIFFPETKAFLAPYDVATRYPMVSWQFTAQEGLFIEPFAVGSVRSALGAVGNIPAPGYEKTNDDLAIDVAFDESLSGCVLNIQRRVTGYNAFSLIPYLNLMTEKQKQDMVEEMTKSTAPDLNLKKWSLGTADVSKDILTINTEFTSSHFSEKAGPRILFKAGALIGPQSQMYNDHKRTLEIENTFNRGYHRVIKIKLPEGYTIRNPTDLKFDVVYQDGDDAPFLFKSDYTLEGTLLTVTVQEQYNKIFAPVNRFEDFRKVINAAADFNKVTLVLERRN